MRLTKAEKAAGLTPVQALARQVRRLRKKHPGEGLAALLIRALNDRRTFNQFWFYISAVDQEVRRLDQEETVNREAIVSARRMARDKHLGEAMELYHRAAEEGTDEQLPLFRDPHWRRLSYSDRCGTLSAACARRDFDLPDDD